VNSSPTHCVRHPHAFGDKARLVLFASPASNAHHFLKRNDVGVDLAQHFDYTRGSHSTVEPAAFVDVVRDYA
jgi:hypothetical protein